MLFFMAFTPFSGGHMAIVRFDPFRDLAGMQDRINRIFGEAYLRNDDDVLNRGDWRPPVDIYENDQHEIVLRAELPGLKREDLDIRVENNTLTLRGERKHDAEVKQESYHRVERSYGAFSRSFSLPATVNTEQVKAVFADGVLTITLPMREEARPRQIQVQVH
jgi:HSP20 family protein